MDAPAEESTTATTAAAAAAGQGAAVAVNNNIFDMPEYRKYKAWLQDKAAEHEEEAALQSFQARRKYALDKVNICKQHAVKLAVFHRAAMGRKVSVDDRDAVLEYEELVYKLQVVYSRIHGRTQQENLQVLGVFSGWLLASVEQQPMEVTILVDCINGDGLGDLLEEEQVEDLAEIQEICDQLVLATQEQRAGLRDVHERLEQRTEEAINPLLRLLQRQKTLRLRNLERQRDGALRDADEVLAIHLRACRKVENLMVALVTMTADVKCCTTIAQFLYGPETMPPRRWVCAVVHKCVIGFMNAD